MRCSMYGSGKLILVLLILVAGESLGCPTSCTCKWKNGKQTVECNGKGMLVIPDGMDIGTQVLEFSGNNLQTLYREKFLKMDLINLQRIYLSRCRIASIDDRTFKGLTNLVELDLSGNLLEAVPTETFQDCPSLMRLSLNSNPINTVRRAAFNHLSFLNTLELSNCDISRVEEGAFQNLYSLEWLYLNGNKLTTLEGTQYFPESLKGLQLQENTWDCDCHIIELHGWLRAFTIPHSVEPTCSAPRRLEGRIIKSVPETELACLPDISPTTFYLEIGEGKNVSLLCQIHAIPEAHVSWWFQGQLLQNDSMIAPGVHLLYYLEEGVVEKRSELFIFNVNTEDNGTFVCNAENPAGVSQANFTIRVIVKHDYDVVTNELPFKLILIVLSAAAISVILLILVVILSIIKCHRNARMKKKRNNSKVALSNFTKDNLLQESVDEYSEGMKGSSNIKLVNHEEETILYSAHPNEEILRTLSPVATANQIESPASLRRYQLERNPDLINGTESVGRQQHKEGDGQHTENLSSYSAHLSTSACGYMLEAPPCSFPSSMGDFQRNGRDLYQVTPDVHLNPVGLLNSGDVKSQQFNGNCYRTLPYNRSGKRQTAANPMSRYSREAEFLSRSVQPASYEHYCPDVRYTADGYPVRTENAILHPVFMSSSPDSHRPDSAASSVEPCCSSSKVQWPSCVPANLCKSQDTVVKISVGAQTQTNIDNNEITNSKLCNKLLSNVTKFTETLSESPDEGYEGDSIDNTATC